MSTSNKRQLVLPGEMIASGDYTLGKNVYRGGDNNVYSSILGLAEIKGNTVDVIPLRGTYIPKAGDIVIGTVVDVVVGAWVVKLDGIPTALLPFGNTPLGKISPKINPLVILDVGDYVVAKVVTASRSLNTVLTIRGANLGKVTHGVVLKIEPKKVPRFIGKRGSLVNVLMKELKCKIIVGQNGYVWVQTDKREDIALIEKIIRKVERESHVSGLTDRVIQMIFVEKSKEGKGEGENEQRVREERR